MVQGCQCWRQGYGLLVLFHCKRTVLDVEVLSACRHIPRKLMCTRITCLSVVLCCGCCAEFKHLEHACRCSGQLCGCLSGDSETGPTNFEHRKEHVGSVKGQGEDISRTAAQDNLPRDQVDMLPAPVAIPG